MLPGARPRGRHTEHVRVSRGRQLRRCPRAPKHRRDKGFAGAKGASNPFKPLSCRLKNGMSPSENMLLPSECVTPSSVFNMLLSKCITPPYKNMLLPSGVLVPSRKSKKKSSPKASSRPRIHIDAIGGNARGNGMLPTSEIMLPPSVWCRP